MLRIYCPHKAQSPLSYTTIRCTRSRICRLNEAVVTGGETFGCHPFLPEHRYRDKLLRGRIRREDIEAVLIDDLGDRGDELLGFLGTRFHLRMGMLAHRWRTGPAAELRWVVAETNALRRFRDETPQPVRDRVVEATRRWVMRDLRNGTAPREEKRRLRGLIDLLFERFDMRRVETWSSRTWDAFCLHLLWLVCRDGVEAVRIAETRTASARAASRLVARSDR